jgi:uncharacterized membrane protein YqjE
MAQPLHSAHGADNGIAALLRQLRSDAFELLRAELALARAELLVALHGLYKAALVGVIGAVLMLAGLLALLAAAIVGLSTWLPLWLAASAVGVVLLLVGLLTVRASRKQVDAQSLGLTHARHSVQQDFSLLNRKHHEHASEAPGGFPDAHRARTAHGTVAQPHR